MRFQPPCALAAWAVADAVVVRGRPLPIADALARSTFYRAEATRCRALDDAAGGAYCADLAGQFDRAIAKALNWTRCAATRDQNGWYW